MKACKMIDFSERSDSLIKLCKYPAVSIDDLAEIGEIAAYIQLPLERVREGDNLAIYIIDNRIDEIKGFLAIWHDQGSGCIDMGDDTAWGKWDDADKILLTEDFETAEERDGSMIRGRIAYNGHGIRGIYAQGKFYRLIDDRHGFRPGCPAEEIYPLDHAI